MNERFLKLYKLLKKRILILDAAMGTLIQDYNLSESDFRGEKFKNHTCSLIRNNDVLCLRKPEFIKKS